MREALQAREREREKEREKGDLWKARGERSITTGRGVERKRRLTWKGK